MILATKHGDANLRSIDFSGTSTIMPPGGGYSVDGSWAARLVDMRDAVGITAVGSAIRLIQSQVAAMPLGAYSNTDGSFVPQPASWQSELFADPCPGEWTSYTFLEDVAGSLEATANSFSEKVKPARVRSGQPAVAELRPLDPDYCAVGKDANGRKKIVWQSATGTIDITDRCLHIRGSSLTPAPAGKSVLKLHGRALSMHLALDEYQGRYFENDARPGFILSNPNPNITRDQRKDIRESFMARHAGASNAHGLGLLWGQWTATPFDTSLKNTQAVELNDQALREVALMFQIPHKMLGSIAERPVAETPETEFTRFFRISLFGRLRRIELAFTADPDLFGGSPLTARFDPSELLRSDTATTATVIHSLVQAGVMTKNEGRALLSMPRSLDPKADELQATPVGGAPNAPPAPPAEPAPAEE